eukprot:11939662-Alexandrium_andersonii.AAC.1
MPGHQPPEAPAPAEAQAQRPEDPRPPPTDPRAAALAVGPTRLMSGPPRQAPRTTGQTVGDQAPRSGEAPSALDH